MYFLFKSKYKIVYYPEGYINILIKPCKGGIWFWPNPMKIISAAGIKKYRDLTFRAAPRRRITTRAQAVRFVNERQFIYFWPIKDIIMPSLWNAVVGMRPVPFNHDDPGHVT